MSNSNANGGDLHNRYMRCVSDIVSELIQGYEAKRPTNLTKLKGQLAKKHRLPNYPKVFAAFVVPAAPVFCLRSRLSVGGCNRSHSRGVQEKARTFYSRQAGPNGEWRCSCCT